MQALIGKTRGGEGLLEADEHDCDTEGVWSHHAIMAAESQEGNLYGSRGPQFATERKAPARGSDPRRFRHRVHDEKPRLTLSIGLA